MSQGAVVVLNAGSSSLKAGLFRPDPAAFAGERVHVTAEARNIGQSNSHLTVQDAGGSVLFAGAHPVGSAEEALTALAQTLQEHGDGPDIAAIGHRVVHGGPHLREHTLLTPTVLTTLREAIHFAPLHLPSSLALIQHAQERYPRVPQVACFDTAFHQTMPALARRLPIPSAFAAAGVERYGFHGLSYESLLAQVVQIQAVSGGVLPERIVFAHLGGGSSLCAVFKGKSIDTTMGLTPAGGLLMATRSGDLDPGVLLFLARTGGLSIDQLEHLVNHRCGLAGVSETGGDMQEVERAMRDAAATPERRTAAQLAFDQFAGSVARGIAGMIVTLGGLDLLAFAGGIGENSARLREAVIDRLAPFGVRLDQEANAANRDLISTHESPVPVRTLPAREDPMIAAHTRAVLRDSRK